MEFTVKAKSANGKEVTIKLEVTCTKVGVTNRFSATIMDSNVPVTFGGMPSGYYSDGNATTNTAVQAKVITFGGGELNRQATYPFVAYEVGIEKTKRNRLMFMMPFGKKDIGKLFPNR